MGRGKLNMKLITNERSRMVTYHKRKNGLTKKASEFHILCDVDACVIIFGPKISNRPVDVETWPKDRNEVRRIINKFNAKTTERKKTQDLSDFFLGRKKKVDDEVVKLRRAYLEAKFPVWDHRLNTYRPRDLKMLAKAFEERLEVARNSIMTLKGHPFWSDETLTATTGGGFLGKNHNQMSSAFTNALIQKNIEMEQHGFQFLKPSDIQFPTCYQPDQSLHQMGPFNVNPTNNLMMFMMMNDDFNPKIPCPSLLNGPVYYNFEPAGEVVGNWVVNNPVPHHHPISYYGPGRQPIVGYSKGPMMQNGSSQICYPQFSDFCEINENDQMNKREVLGMEQRAGIFPANLK